MKRLLPILLLCIALICAGCNGEPNVADPGPETTAPPEIIETVASSADSGDLEMIQAYDSVLKIYNQALTECWNQGQCAEAGISILTTYCLEGENPLHNLCFAFCDLDGDGDKELMISPTFQDGFVDKMLFALYDLENGTPRLLLTGYERIRYYLCLDESGEWWIANESSGGAGNSGWFYSRYDGTGLMVEISVLYDAESAPEAPWFLGTDASWELQNKEAVEEASAREIISSFEAKIVDVHKGFTDQRTFFDLT